MKIGFEAKRAFTNGTGLGHYSRTLISSLATYFSENEYYLFTPKQTNMFLVQQLQNVQTIIPSSFPATVLKTAWRSSWVKKDLKKWGINIFHGLSHEIPINIQKTGIKSVVTIHDLIFERHPEQYNPLDVKIYRKKFKYACQNADRIIAISQQTKDDIIQFYKIDKSKIDICYQSCNPAFGLEISLEEKQRVKKYYQLPEQYFLYVGSIIERKNLLMICKGLNLIKNKIKIPLVVIGGGSKYKQEVVNFIQQNNLQQQVIFLSDKFSNESFKNAVDFPAIYQQALCMIYPSVFEGFGIPVLEALWSKIPVITSNVSCMPETGGNAALYINPNSEVEMAEALVQMATNKSLKDEMIVKGIAHAQNFTQFKCAEAVMNVYRKILDSSF